MGLTLLVDEKSLLELFIHSKFPSQLRAFNDCDSPRIVDGSSLLFGERGRDDDRIASNQGRVVEGPSDGMYDCDR